MLNLGWTYNILKDDRDAVRWFDLARQQSRPEDRGRSIQGYHNLEPDFSRFRTTVWASPVFSTRWHDLFAYAQMKTELRLPRLVSASRTYPRRFDRRHRGFRIRCEPGRAVSLGAQRDSSWPSAWRRIRGTG